MLFGSLLKMTVVLVCAASLGSLFFAELPSKFKSATLLFTSHWLLILAFVVLTRSGPLWRRLEALKNCLASGQSILKFRRPAPPLKSFKPKSSEQILTLMFVDIVGFSQIAERTSPREMFERLQEVLGSLSSIVRRHGGCIDKTLGDGLLCFFGYTPDGKSNGKNQADSAIACAIEMQRSCLYWNLDNIKSQRPVFPIRIGINTANVFVGYLGDEDNKDFTIIGNGVNFAQRLESACEPMSLLISSTTLDFSSNYTQNSIGIKTKRIKIKHHSELFSAVEIDPNVGDEVQKAVLVEVFRNQQNLDRKEQRWSFDTPHLLSVQTNFGRANLKDFSLSGGCIILPMYLARGVQLEIDLKATNDEYSQKLLEKGIEEILIEVCWSRPVDGGFAHGIRFLSLNRQQNHFVFQSFREILSQPRYKTGSVQRIS